MGIGLTFPGTDWSQYGLAPYVPPPPFLANSLGWFYPNTAELVSGSSVLITDHSPLNHPATLAGTPTLNAGFMSCGAPATGQWLQTQLLDPGTDFTIVVVARSADTFGSGNANSPKWITNYGGDGNANGVTGFKSCSIQILSPTSVGATDTVNNAGAANIIQTNLTGETSGVFASWGVYAETISTVSGVTTRTFYDLTRGTSSVNSITTARVVNAANAYKVGGNVTTALGGLGDVAFAGFFNLGMTSQNLATLKAAIVSHLAGLPTPVTGF